MSEVISTQSRHVCVDTLSNTYYHRMGAVSRSVSSKTCQSRSSKGLQESVRERERTERRYTDTRIQVGADTFGSCFFFSVFAGTEQEMLFLSFGTY